MALPKANRLTLKKDFDLVFGSTKCVAGDFLFVKYLKNDSERRRFGIVVPTKVLKRATARNRIKRMIAEAVRLHLREMQGGVDAVIVANPKIADKEFTDIEKAVVILLKKSDIIYEKGNNSAD